MSGTNLQFLGQFSIVRAKLLLHMLGRQQLASVTADMAVMSEKWQIDVQEVEELAAVAGSHLHCKHRHFAMTFCYWSCSHKAYIPACVSLACV